jgi:serine/threonine-protein kinase HipA
LPNLGEADQVHELIRKIIANEPVPQAQRRLIAPGVSLGGVRPKALIEIDGQQWILKFSAGDPAAAPLIEHAAMTLASKAQINVAQTRAVPLVDGHAVAIRRFDRRDSERLHALTAHVALRAAGERYGYPELAQLLRRRGVVERDTYLRDMRELFRRMVFNILIDNTDDHEKNHALLMTTSQHYTLAPAYDVLPAGQALGFQQMRVGEAEADATLDNALSMAQLFALDRKQAVAEIRGVARVLATWREHFKSQGVTRADIDFYAQHIDRAFLSEQRQEYL